MTLMEKLNRISEIDDMFILAKGWGSWMAEASMERMGLVQDLRAVHGLGMDDKFQLRTGSGSRVT